jgi:hypothetical protein
VLRLDTASFSPFLGLFVITFTLSKVANIKCLYRTGLEGVRSPDCQAMGDVLSCIANIKAWAEPYVPMMIPDPAPSLLVIKLLGLHASDGLHIQE